MNEPFNVFLIGETGKVVTAKSDYQVVPAYGFHDHPKVDVLIVVGGFHDDEMNKSTVIDWISKQAKKSSIVASVCTGAFLLAQARVLQTQKVTTHWECISDLRGMFPGLEVIEGARWVDEGELLTSGGISAGIDMSLHLVSKLYGEDLAEKTAKEMEFSWTKNS